MFVVFLLKAIPQILLKCYEKPNWAETNSDFSEKILSAVKNLPENWHRKTTHHRKKLAKQYSEINEIKLIKKLVKKISSFY